MLGLPNLLSGSPTGGSNQLMIVKFIKKEKEIVEISLWEYNLYKDKNNQSDT